MESVPVSSNEFTAAETCKTKVSTIKDRASRESTKYSAKVSSVTVATSATASAAISTDQLNAKMLEELISSKDQFNILKSILHDFFEIHELLHSRKESLSILNDFCCLHTDLDTIEFLAESFEKHDFIRTELNNPSECDPEKTKIELLLTSISRALAMAMADKPSCNLRMTVSDSKNKASKSGIKLLSRLYHYDNRH